MRRELALVALLILGFPQLCAAAERVGLGRPPTAREIAAWDIDVRADGRGLPAGHGSVGEGAALYGQKCAGCHGEKGAGKPADVLVGGAGTLASVKPVKTVGSFWPYAPTLFDYVRRAMPFDHPQSLTNDEVYAVSAYLLSLNGVVPADVTLDANSLSAVKMPNRGGFEADPRPDVR
ncbi:MAG: cytochrome c [Hansschlegelia sp.]